ncbi:MAG: hypothetical protein IJL63_04280 [Clostridia bacterium]|nr:hypothetical protein [Clostridia bacterium]
MRIRKFLLLLLLIIFVFLLSGINSFAEEPSFDYSRVYSEADNSVREMLDEIGVSSVDTDELINISFINTVKLIVEIFKGRLKEPLRIILVSVAVLIICSVSTSLSASSIKKDSYYDTVFSFVTLITFVYPLTNAISTAVSSLKVISGFMLSYIPTFTAIASASGKTASSLTYSSVMLGFASLLESAASFLAKPIIIFLTVSVFLSFDNSLSFTRAESFFKKLVTVFLSVSSALFVGLTNLKAGLAMSADSIAVKGIKLTSGSVIPIIGNSVGDAIASILGSMELIKNTVGVFGIITICLCVLPSLSEMLIWYFCLFFLSFVAETVNMRALESVIKSIMSTLSLINVLLIYSALIFVLITGNLLSIRG